MIYNRLIVAAIGFIRLEPYDGKLSRTVWDGGKGSDYFKALPIIIYNMPSPKPLRDVACFACSFLTQVRHIDLQGSNCITLQVQAHRIHWKRCAKDKPSKE